MHIARAPIDSGGRRVAVAYEAAVDRASDIKRRKRAIRSDADAISIDIEIIGGAARDRHAQHYCNRSRFSQP